MIKKKRARGHEEKSTSHLSDSVQEAIQCRAELGGPSMSNRTDAANDTDRIGHEVEVVCKSRLAKTTHTHQRDRAAPQACGFLIKPPMP